MSRGARGSERRRANDGASAEAPEDARSFYGRWATVYDLIARRTPGIPRLRRRAVAACRLDPGDTVVEMGCGTGANLGLLREAVGARGTVVGLDFTGPVLERARAHATEFDNVHVVRADATDPPVVEGSVDAILASFVVGMIERPGESVDAWFDLVEADGHVVLLDAARSGRWYAPVVNPAFRAVVIGSTPPTGRIRYESAPTETLDARVDAARRRLRARSRSLVDERHFFGIVRLTGGRVRTERGA